MYYKGEQSMKPNSLKYRIDKDLIAYRIINGETVILNLDNGYYYNLDGAGTDIWQAIDQGLTLDEILELLKKEYGAPETILKKDMLEFIKNLEQKKLIKKLI